MQSVKKNKAKPAAMSPNFAKIPETLKSQRRWVVWRWVWKDNKWDKPLFRPNGNAASSTDPDTWVTLPEAQAAAKNFDGVGFAMGKGCGLVGVDLDYCRNPTTGEITPLAQRIIDELDTYAEVSPSGEGVKLWLEGSIGDTKQWKHKNKELGLEIYWDGRYFTVTGNALNSKPIARAGRQLERFLANYMQRNDAMKERPKDPSHTIEVAQDAISYIDANCDYETWTDIGMALKWLDDSLFETWVDWSQSAPRDVQASREKCQTHWDSFPGAKGAITIGTLFYYAKQAGWVMPPTLYEASDYGVARRVRDRVDGRIVYVPEWGQWLAWDGRSYSTDTSGQLAEITVAVSKAMLTEMPETEAVKTGNEKEDKQAEKEAKQKDAAWAQFCKRYQSARGISDVEKLCRGLMSISYRDLNQNQLLFHCQNGVINLGKNNRFDPHDKANMNTHVSEVVYDAAADCPRWKQFIKEITREDDDLADYLQRIVGYCLSGLITEQAMFILHGDGQNGKGVFTRAVLRLLGPYGGPISQDLLMASPNQHPTQFAYLHNMRCVVAQETDQDCRLNENQVKLLTGGDPIIARRMREDFWSFNPTHKIFLATNHVPYIRGTDHGIWRRIKLIPFLAKFDGKRTDPKLDETLAAELSGILNWALDGWDAYQFDSLHEPKCVVEARSTYKAEMSVVQQFVEDRCSTEDKEAETSIAELYQSFKFYCEMHGHYPCSNRKFGVDLTALGIEPGRTKNSRVRRGIKLLIDEISQ